MNSLCARVSAVARANPRSIAIVDGVRQASYGELWEQIEGFAGHLRACGLRPGERVALILPNRIEAAVACYAIWHAGGIAVPLNVRPCARAFYPGDIAGPSTALEAGDGRRTGIGPGDPVPRPQRGVEGRRCVFDEAPRNLRPRRRTGPAPR